VAVRAVLPAFTASLNAKDRAFGDIPKDVHFNDFVSLRRGSMRWAVSIIRIGPHEENDELLSKTTIRTCLLLTSRGKTLWKHQLAETPGGAFAEHYRLSRVITQSGKSPMVPLFSDFGGNTRDFMYPSSR
jgi:hypothetical protein